MSCCRPFFLVGTTVKKFLMSQDGATSIEYAVIAACIFLAIVLAVSLLGGGTKTLWENRVAKPVTESM